jgi:hypothetical protein
LLLSRQIDSASGAEIWNVVTIEQAPHAAFAITAGVAQALGDFD